MATQKGVWNLQQVRDKQLQSLWSYTGGDNLWWLGNGEYGRSGLNETNGRRSSPTQVSGEGWTVSNTKDCGESVMGLMTKSNGTLWSWGYGGNGLLGVNDNTWRSSPVQIGTDTDWDPGKHANGRYFGAAIKTDGTMWIWGSNGQGGLGQNSTVQYSSPVQIPGTTWSKVAGGKEAMGAIKTDGTLWFWGNNELGEFGVNDKIRRSSPIQVPGTTWSTLDLGRFTCAATKTDGTLWTWGSATYGGLGLNSHTQRSSPTQIPGTTWSMAQIQYPYVGAGLKTDGTLWMWGRNNNGTLGQNQDGANNVKYSSPVQVPGTTWSDISLGSSFILAKKTDGTLWGWGDGNYGTLGQNSTTKYSSPVQIPGTSWGNLTRVDYGTFLTTPSS